MSIPGSLLTYLTQNLEINVKQMSPVSGGSINRAVLLGTSETELFLKWNDSAPRDMFHKEAKGLELLGETETNLVIPSIVAFNSENEEIPGFLLMEYIKPQRGDGKASRKLGQELAKLHTHTASSFGLNHHNYIGRLPQSNTPHSSWVSFFIDERIEPQLKMAFDRNALKRSVHKNWSRLAGKLPDIFPPAEPSLIHGDLWGGNYFFDSENRPVLIDPAVYYGHPEMEIAFTKMFGGFSDIFYDAYAFESPLEPGFNERVEIYNLYPLLVHANLFGGHYASQAETFLRQF